MEIKLSWSKLFVIWIVFAIVTVVLAIPGVVVAAVVGGLAGLTGYWAGLSEQHLKIIGSLIGLATYFGASMIALKYALSKPYREFRIVLMRTQNL